MEGRRQSAGADDNLGETARGLRLTSLQAILDVAARLGDSLSPDPVFATVLEVTCEVFATDRAAIFHQNEAGDYVCPASCGLSAGYVKTICRHFPETPGGRAIATRRPVPIADLAAATRAFPTGPAVVAEGLQSALALPLLRRGEPVGYLAVYHNHTHEYGDAEMQVGQALANLAAVAIDNARLHQAVELRAQESEALHEATKQILVSLDLEAVLHRILDNVVRLTSAEFAGVQLLDADGVTLRFAAARGSDLGAASGVSLRLGEGLSGTVAATGEVINAPDVHADPRWLPRPSSDWIRSGLFIPLRNGARPIGVLVACSQQRAHFNPARERLLVGLAEQAALAIQRAREIADRRRAEEALRASEDRYRDLVEHSHALICTHDLAGRILSINRGAAQQLGYDESRFLDLTIPDLLSPEVRHEFPAYLEQVRRDGFASGLMSILTPSGERRILEYHNSLRTEGVDSPIVRAIAHDVTERYLAEKRLAESLARERGAHAEAEASRRETAALYEATKQIMGSLDLTATLDRILESIVYLSEADFAGIQLLDTSGTTLEYVATSGAQAHLFKDVRLRLGQGLGGIAALTGEVVRAPTAEQDQRWGIRPIAEAAGIRSALCIPLRTRDQVIGVLTALSQQPAHFSPARERLLFGLADQAALAIDHARLFAEVGKIEALRELNRLKSEFLGTISHELRTPLSLVYGYVELLLAREMVGSGARPLLDEIHRGARQLTRLVDDLIDFAGIERGELVLERAEIDLGALTLDTVSQFAATAPSHQLTFDIPDESLLMHGDAKRLRQVLHHLLSNAVRYSASGGTIVVRASASDDGVQVSVADQGIGLAPEQLDRLFEKFYRARTEVMHRQPGLGLGLAICRAIVEAHGGRIWAESPGPGQGATFSFRLPRSN